MISPARHRAALTRPSGIVGDGAESFAIAPNTLGESAFDLGIVAALIAVPVVGYYYIKRRV